MTTFRPLPSLDWIAERESAAPRVADAPKRTDRRTEGAVKAAAIGAVGAIKAMAFKILFVASLVWVAVIGRMGVSGHFHAAVPGAAKMTVGPELLSAPVAAMDPTTAQLYMWLVGSGIGLLVTHIIKACVDGWASVTKIWDNSERGKRIAAETRLVEGEKTFSGRITEIEKGANDRIAQIEAACKERVALNLSNAALTSQMYEAQIASLKKQHDDEKGLLIDQLTFLRDTNKSLQEDLKHVNLAQHAEAARAPVQPIVISPPVVETNLEVHTDSKCPPAPDLLATPLPQAQSQSPKTPEGG